MRCGKRKIYKQGEAKGRLWDADLLVFVYSEDLVRFSFFTSQIGGV